jgi:lysosomal-associated membrane protein 1/2
MYKFLGKNNATNVILQGDITFNLTYSAMHKHTESIVVKVPPPGDDVDLQADIFDLSKDTKMAPAWMVFTALNGTFNLTFGLQGVQATNQQWSLQYVVLKYMNFTAHSTHDNSGCVMANVSNVKTSWGRGFKCSTEDFHLTSEDSNVTFAQVSVQGFQLQAFSFSHAGQLDAQPSLCTQDMADNKIVPIAVGAALGLLVIIVVIAYIIGRFRNRGKKSDYEVISS